MSKEQLTDLCEKTWNTCYPDRRPWSEIGDDAKEEWIRVFGVFAGMLENDSHTGIGAEIGMDAAWPANLMCRLLLPVPVKELAAIGNALAKIAKKQGKEARMKQIGQTLEIFTVQNITALPEAGRNQPTTP